MVNDSTSADEKAAQWQLRSPDSWVKRVGECTPSAWKPLKETKWRCTMVKNQDVVRGDQNIANEKLAMAIADSWMDDIPVTVKPTVAPKATPTDTERLDYLDSMWEKWEDAPMHSFEFAVAELGLHQALHAAYRWLIALARDGIKYRQEHPGEEPLINGVSTVDKRSEKEDNHE